MQHGNILLCAGGLHHELAFAFKVLPRLRVSDLLGLIYGPRTFAKSYRPSESIIPQLRR